MAKSLHIIAGCILLVMFVGDLPSNPLVLILFDQFKIKLALLMQQIEIVMIAAPAVELISEALALAPLANGTILVAKAMSTSTLWISESIVRPQCAGVNILGMHISNRVTVSLCDWIVTSDTLSSSLPFFVGNPVKEQ